MALGKKYNYNMWTKEGRGKVSNVLGMVPSSFMILSSKVPNAPHANSLASCRLKLSSGQAPLLPFLPFLPLPPLLLLIIHTILPLLHPLPLLLLWCGRGRGSTDPPGRRVSLLTYLSIISLVISSLLFRALPPPHFLKPDSQHAGPSCLQNSHKIK